MYFTESKAFWFDPGSRAAHVATSNRSKDSPWVGKCCGPRVRANSLFPWAAKILEWRKAFCALLSKKKHGPHLFKYQEVTLDSKSNPLSESSEEGSGATPSSSTRNSSGSFFHWDSFCFSPKFSIESSLCVYSPLCWLESLCLCLQLPCSSSSLFPRDVLKVIFFFVAPASTSNGKLGSLSHFFQCCSQADEGSLTTLFILKFQKTISELILFPFYSLPPIKKKWGRARKEKKKIKICPGTDFERNLINTLLSFLYGHEGKTIHKFN